MKFFYIILLFLISCVSVFGQSISTETYRKYKIYDARILKTARLCISDSNLISFRKIDTLGSTLTLDVNLDSLKINKPSFLSYINFELKQQESCVIPLKIWIKRLNSLDKNIVDDSQYIELNAAFLNCDNNFVSFSQPIELTNNNYQIVVKFYSSISRN